jgi:SAM-dependent methyltransferase
MAFSVEWEERFAANKNHSLWPWSDLVSFCNRYGKLSSDSSVLELGCGVGANVPFFKTLGCDYYAIEGSKSAVNFLENSYPDWKGRFFHGDFTKNIPGENKFDLIIDRSALTHNSTNAIKSALKLVEKRLKPAGIFIGIDWFSKEDDNYREKAESISDNNTKKFKNGLIELSGVGEVHFSTYEHLQELFSDFYIIAVEEKILKCCLSGKINGFFNLVVSKI